MTAFCCLQIVHSFATAHSFIFDADIKSRYPEAVFTCEGITRLELKVSCRVARSSVCRSPGTPAGEQPPTASPPAFRSMLYG
jgi:hypothetical protein